VSNLEAGEPLVLVYERSNYDKILKNTYGQTCILNCFQGNLEIWPLWAVALNIQVKIICTND